MLLEIDPRRDHHRLFGMPEPDYEQVDGPLHLIVDRDGKLYLNYYPDVNPDLPMCVSARTIAQYEEWGCTPQHAVTSLAASRAQVIDVGAGLSEFAATLALHTPTKPIIIDPLPYEKVDALFADAYPASSRRAKEVITTLRKRIETILNPEKITLYNMTIQHAIMDHPDALIHSADVVIDCKGPGHYAGEAVTITQLELLLLKTNDKTKLWRPREARPQHAS